MLIDAHNDVVDAAGKIVSDAYTYAGQRIWEWHKEESKWFTGNDLPNFCIDLSAGYKHGRDYYDVH